MLKKQTLSSFVYYDVKRRTKKKDFFKQMDLIINWTKISQELNKKIKRCQSDAFGRAAYAPIILFKMMLVQTWYKLSDEGVEDMINDSISANEFCGLKIEDTVPDHSTLSRFRKELTELDLMDKLLNKINRQLKRHKILVSTGAIVDATITESPWKNSPPNYISKDRAENEEESYEFENSVKQGSDAEGKWLKKGKKTYFGYKQHVATNNDGLILGVHTVSANEYEGKGLEPLLDKVQKEHDIKEVSSDKGYSSLSNREMLSKRGLKDRIQKKATKSKPLNYWEKSFNKQISKYRYKIERTFGSCKKWFGGGIARYKGLCKVHTQHILQAIAYNLKRGPRLLISKNQ